MDRRRRVDLLPLIQKWVAPGSTIVTDEWRAYDCLTREGFDHENVCHKREWVSKRGFHTQGVERSWLGPKATIVKRGRGTPYLQAHLYEANYRLLKRDTGRPLFMELLMDLQSLRPAS